jgi:hypothetical protein
MSDDNVTAKRWLLTIIYDTTVGPVIIDHEIEEISEAQSIVERGPDWNCILDIAIQLNRVSSPTRKLEGWALGDKP